MSEIIDDLNWRYACKKFDPSKKISGADLETVLDALLLTASSYGLQPWEFVVVTNEEKRKDLVSASYNQKQVLDASHLIVLCIKKNIGKELVDSYIFDISKKRNQSIEALEGFRKMLMTLALKEEEVKRAWAKNQLYIAMGNLLHICARMRIDACPMEGIVSKKYDDILGLDKLGIETVMACPIGFRASGDDYSKAEKIRFDKDKLINFIS